MWRLIELSPASVPVISWVLSSASFIKGFNRLETTYPIQYGNSTQKKFLKKKAMVSIIA